MKSILLLSVILFSTNLFSQSPSYFENNQEWLSTFSFYSPGISDCVENSTYVDYVNGDTLVSGVTYKKIGRRYTTSYFPMSSATCPNDSWGDISCHRIIRQSNDSVFEYMPQSGSEELIISYNLNVGDSFTLTSFVNYSYSVQDIDTITLNGQQHRVYLIDTVNNYIVIEGVGHYSSENGGFMDFWGFGGGVDHTTSLDCYAQNSVTYWSHPDITMGSCSYLHDLGINSLVHDFNFQLFPNPTHDVLNIESTQDIISIQIISPSGQTVLEQSLDDINSIDIGSIQSGNYIIIVKDDEGKLSNQPFQKL